MSRSACVLGSPPCAALMLTSRALQPALPTTSATKRARKSVTTGSAVATPSRPRAAKAPSASTSSPRQPPTPSPRRRPVATRSSPSGSRPSGWQRETSAPREVVWGSPQARASPPPAAPLKRVKPEPVEFDLYSGDADDCIIVEPVVVVKQPRRKALPPEPAPVVQREVSPELLPKLEEVASQRQPHLEVEERSLPPSHSPAAPHSPSDSTTPSPPAAPSIASFLASLPLPLLRLLPAFDALGCTSPADLVALADDSAVGRKARKALLDGVAAEVSVSRWERMVLEEGLRVVRGEQD